MSDWIDCKQEMPQDGHAVLVVWMGTVQHLTYSRSEGEWYVHAQDYEPSDATFTHWMPLPAPPETEAPHE